jgi:uncharacterized protein
MNPKLSIIIPVGPTDRAPWDLIRQIRSALSHCEIILASGERRESLIDDKVIAVHSPWGRAKQMNAATQVARGEWLWFLHADSQAPEATLARAAEIAGQTADARSLHFFRLQFEKGSAGFASPLLSITEVGTRFRSSLLKMPFGDQGFLLPRCLLLSLGGYREDVEYGEDHLLAWDARRAGIALVPENAPLITSPRKYLTRGWWTTTRDHVVATWRQAAPQWLLLWKEQSPLKNKVGMAVFVKTPALSPVKTRLAKEKGSDFAIRFYEASLEVITELGERLRKAGITPYWALAEPSHPAQARWQHFKAIHQGTGELGHRLHRVYLQLVTTHRVGILIGADSPQLDVSDFQLALQRLLTHDFVIGPARDGGFYLFAGKKRVPESVWGQVQYSTSGTADQLIALLKPLGSVALLPVRTDVDEPQDLFVLREELAKKSTIKPTDAQKRLWELVCGSDEQASD